MILCVFMRFFLFNCSWNLSDGRLINSDELSCTNRARFLHNIFGQHLLPKKRLNLFQCFQPTKTGGFDFCSVYFFGLVAIDRVKIENETGLILAENPLPLHTKLPFSPILIHLLCNTILKTHNFINPQNLSHIYHFIVIIIIYFSFRYK